MSYRIGLVGATGVTGEVTLRVPEQRAFPLRELRLFASRRSVGQTIRWQGRDHAVEALEDGRFAGLGLVVRKMLHAPALLVHATAVRVPVLVGHSRRRRRSACVLGIAR